MTKEQEIRERHESDNDNPLNTADGETMAIAYTEAFRDRAYLLTELDRMRENQRTPGTVEVCGAKSCNRIIYGPHDVCTKKDCPLKPARGA